MISGWIINYKDGHREAMCEAYYKVWSERNIKDTIQSEEHWFDISDGMRKYGIETILI